MPFKFRRSGSKVVGTKPSGQRVTFNTTSIRVAKRRAAIRESFARKKSK